MVMESTALYWKPVWMALQGHVKLYLAQAQSNRTPRPKPTCSIRRIYTVLVTLLNVRGWSGFSRLASAR